MAREIWKTMKKDLWGLIQGIGIDRPT